MNTKASCNKLIFLTLFMFLLTAALQYVFPGAGVASSSQSTVTISLTKEAYCTFTTTSLNVALPTPHPFSSQDIFENASLEFTCTDAGTTLDWQIGPGRWNQGSVYRMRQQDRESYLPYSVVFNPPPPTKASANPAEAGRVCFIVKVNRDDVAAAPAGIYTDSVTFTLSY